MILEGALHIETKRNSYLDHRKTEIKRFIAMQLSYSSLSKHTSPPHHPLQNSEISINPGPNPDTRKCLSICKLIVVYILPFMFYFTVLISIFQFLFVFLSLSFFLFIYLFIYYVRFDFYQFIMLYILSIYVRTTLFL